MRARQRRWMSKTAMADSMVLTAIVLAIIYWALEALLNIFAPSEISFYRNILGPNVGDMSMRIIALCLFLIFGSHVQFTINQRNRAEQGLRESEEKYRNILETIEEGYYEVDQQGRFVFVNDATSRFLGVPKADLLGRNIREFLNGDSDQKLAATFASCLASGRPVKAFDCELRQQEAARFIEASVALRRANGGAAIGFRGMLRDRTEKKKLELDLLESYRKLQNARAATILGLAKLAEYRDEGTGTHLERIREYARLLAEEMAARPGAGEAIDPDFVEEIYQSSILHDIGKVGIPDAVLLKPSGLTAAEFEVIKCHTRFGGDALAAIESQIEGRSFLQLGREIAYHHHEKWDGSGYPAGLKGCEIPLAARIVAVADVYDALTSKRFYKEAFSHERAREIISELRGSHFDPAVVDAFLSLERRFERIRKEALRQAGEEPSREEGVCQPGGKLAAA